MYLKKIEIDKTLSIWLAPKLTDNHIYVAFDKMRGRYATQALSRTVAAAILTYCRFKELPEMPILQPSCKQY